jgi:hypothetical protein
MSDVPNLSGRLEDLAAREEATGPYQLRSILAVDTWGQRRLSRRKLRILRHIDPVLRPMLVEGERVVFLTSGSFSSVWEMVLGGWATQLINQRAVVVTDRRLLLLQISTAGKPRFVRAQVEYGTIHDVTTTLFGNLWIHFRDGGRQMVAGVPRRDRAALEAAVSRMAQLAPASAGGGVEELCPHCGAVPDDGAAACRACGGRFKSPRHAMALSFLFPGMGDVYLGHKGFAALEIAVALFLWLGLLVLALDPSLPPTAFYLTVGLVLLFMHGGDALATRHIARGGLYPAAGAERPWSRYLVAAVVPVLVLAGSANAVSARRGLTPAPTLLAGADVPERHVAALRDAGYLEPDEAVVHFYSAGIGTILEDGNIQTDRRLVTYAQQAGGRFYDALDYDSIVDLSLGPWVEAPGLSALRVVGDDGRWFVLLVPAADGQDTIFLRAVEERWRAGRTVAPGIWFDGGGGVEPEDAIVIRGVTSPDDIVAAEEWWLDMSIDPGDGAWEVRSRVRQRLHDREVDEVVVRMDSGAEQVVYFDVTGAR